MAEALDAAVDVGGSPLAPTAVAVVDRRVESHDTVTLTLARVDGAPVGAEVLGRFCMLWVPGVGESAISVSGATSDGALEHTVKRVGAVTAALCAATVGDVIGLRGPFGAGWERAPDGSDLIIIGGGIGLAPLRPVVRDALADRDRLGRVDVLVGARTPDDLLFTDELEAWRDDPSIEVHRTVDLADDRWDGDVGVVTRLLGRVGGDPATATAMVCGPEVMLRVTARALVDVGVPPEQVQVSLERNMRCGIGHCGHCQLGPLLLCRQGPVHRWPDVAALLEVPEL